VDTAQGRIVDDEEIKAELAAEHGTPLFVYDLDRFADNARRLAAALDAVERGGSLLVFGVAAPDVELAVSPFRIYNQELRIVGSMAIVGTPSMAASSMSDRQSPVLPLPVMPTQTACVTRSVESYSRYPGLVVFDPVSIARPR